MKNMLGCWHTGILGDLKREDGWTAIKEDYQTFRKGY